MQMSARTFRRLATVWDGLMARRATAPARRGHGRLGLEALEARDVPAAFGLFETGVDAGGIPLTTDAADPHHALTAGGLSAGGVRVVADDRFPIGPWVANDPASWWVVPAGSDGDESAAPGTYVYRATVYEPTSITITGRWAADDSAVIRVNGAATANAASGFGTLSPFTLSGFVSGVNVVEFVVTNGDNGGPNPTGLRVAGVTGSAQPTGTQAVAGVSDTAAGIAGTGAADPHYAVVAGPAGYLGAAVAVVPNPAWVAGGGSGGWVAPAGTDSQANAPVGEYTFATTFDLTGYDPATASLSGSWATDNVGVGIYLNGVSVGSTHGGADPGTGVEGFRALEPFAASAGFLAGVNTLTFVVRNQPRYDGDWGNPAGLRVDNLRVFAAPVVVSVSAIVDTAVEDGDNGLIRVSRTGSTQDDLWVELDIGGVAQNGIDYQAIPTVIHFLAGQADYDIPLVAVPDSEVEGSESVTVAVVLPVGPPIPYVVAQPPAAAKVDDRFFLSNLTYSGTKKVDVYRDTPDAAGRPAKYDGTLLGDWLDFSPIPNGNADDKVDFKYPVAFVRDSQVAVQVGIGVKAAAFQGRAGLKIRGEGPDGIVFEGDAELGKNLLNRDILKFKTGPVGAADGTATPQVVKLPNTVKDYPAFTIQWKVYDGQKWSNVGSTVNHLYDLYDTPKGAVTPYETLLDIAVRNATGKDSVADIVDAVWKDFKDPATPVKRKAIDGQNTPDGAGMTYWLDRKPVWTVAQYAEINDQINSNANAKRFTLEALVSPSSSPIVLSDGTKVDLVNVGQCQAWSDLFAGVLKAVGIGGATRYMITPNNAITGGNAVGNYGLLVNDWTFAANPTNPVADGIFNYTVNTDVTDAQGKPGQGTANPPGAFFAHFAVIFDSGNGTKHVYDPSYGTDFDDEKKWEEGSLAGFFKFVPGKNARAVKNDPNVVQVTFAVG